MPDYPAPCSELQTARLRLPSLGLSVLEALLRRDFTFVEQSLHVDVSRAESIDDYVLKLRISQLQADPSLEPWLLRAVCLREPPQCVGHLGFHDRPGSEHLQPWAPGGVELGYTILAAHRRRGYALEACRSLIGWAVSEHSVRCFAGSTSPDNLASIGLLGRLGFVRKGSVIDELDGLEDVYVLNQPPAG